MLREIVAGTGLIVFGSAAPAAVMELDPESRKPKPPEASNAASPAGLP